MEFAKRTREKYSPIFDNGDGGDGYAEEKKLQEGWGWYTSFYALAKGDVRYFEEVGKLRASQAFTFLVFEKQKNEVERIVLKKKVNNA